MLDSYRLIKSKTYFHIYFILMIINKMGCDSLSAYLMASLFQLFLIFNFFNRTQCLPHIHTLGKHSTIDPNPPTFLYICCSEIHTIVPWCSQQTNVATKREIN